MGDNSSEFNINIRTAADVAGLKNVQTELKQVSTVGMEAARAGEQLVIAHGKAAAAAEGHAHSNSTLRLAARGANDAAFALSDLMQGNMLVAFHRAKFAAEDLGIAMKTAFAPTALIVGATLAVELLSHYVTSQNEAAEATKEHGKEAEKAADKVFDLNHALREQQEETEAMSDPMKGMTMALENFDKIAARVTDSSGNLKAAFEEARKASEQLDKAVEGQVKRIDEEVNNTKRLIDAEKELLKAKIELQKTEGKVFPDDAAMQSGMADKRAELAKIDADARARAMREQVQQTAAIETRNRAAGTGAEAAQLREQLKASGLQDLLREGEELGIGPGKLTSGADIREFAQRRAQEMAKGSLGGLQTPEEFAAIDKVTQKLEEIAKLFDAASTKTRAAQAEDEAAKRQEAHLAEMRRTDKPLAEIDNVRTATLNTELQAIYAKQADKQQREALERTKKQLEEYLKVNGQSPSDAAAAAQDLQLKRTNRTTPELERNGLFQARAEVERRLALVEDRLNVRGAPNAAEAAGRSAFDRQAEAQRAFGEQPANLRIAAEAMDATRGRANDSTVSGTIAQQIQTASQELQQGRNVDENGQKVVQLMEQFIEAIKATHGNTQRQDVRLQQIERDLQQVQSQQRNGRQ